MVFISFEVSQYRILDLVGTQDILNSCRVLTSKSTSRCEDLPWDSILRIIEVEDASPLNIEECFQLTVVVTSLLSGSSIPDSEAVHRDHQLR